MQGLTKDTGKIFRAVSLLQCLKGYILIGGTALSLQIKKRKSEDLDFCIWTKKLKKDKPAIDWPVIEKDLETVGPIESRDILGFDQVNFTVRGVRISFVAKTENLSPVKHPVPVLNNIYAADICAIGIMKVELILRRSEFRDYYDIFSVLKEGIPLKDIITGAVKYSNHRLKTRDALAFLSNGNNYKPEKGFSLLEPFYDINNKGIEEYIKTLIRKEYIS